MKNKRICFGFCLIITLIYGWIYMLQTERQIVSRGGCKLVPLDPWDGSIMQYIHDPVPPSCSHREQLMFVDDLGYLVFNETVLLKYDLDKKILRCTYSILKRMNGDFDVTFEREVNFVTPVFIKGHMFRVKCVNKTDVTVYDYLHFNSLWNDDAKSDDEIDRESIDNLSLVIIGIDGVSRSHAVRSIPNTYKFLLEEFGAYDFKGYSKVGDTTEPNLLALLSGKSFYNFRFSHLFKKNSDEWPWIWKNEKMKHFATFFAEDGPDIPMFKKRLKFAPTDYYYRPYTLGMLKFEPKVVESLGNSSRSCYGVNEQFDLQMKYFKGFLSRYAGKRKFAMLWINSIAHDDFNGLQLGDARLRDFFKWLKYTYQSQYTLFMVLSDHGNRGSQASMTYTGRAESHKPWFMIHVPSFLRKKYQSLNNTLSLNTKRLISPYDVYQTLSDILNKISFKDHCMTEIQQKLVRRSLLHEIPKDRTCADAGLDGEFCFCERKTNVSTKLKLVKDISKFLVSNINNILSQHQNVCYVFTLHDVIDSAVIYSKIDYNRVRSNLRQENLSIPAYMYKYMSSILSKKQTGRYTIVISTLPGNAVFEGTVDFWRYGITWNSKQMNMVGEPKRLDWYGNTSHCVQEYGLKPFCHCRQMK